MKKLHSLVFCALVTPAITLGAGSVLAQQPTEQDSANQQHKSDVYKDDKQSAANTTLSNQNSEGQDSGQSSSMTETDRNKTSDLSGMQNRGYLESAPVNGTQASELIGADVRTNNDDIGSISELIIDESGQVVAILVSVGGFLGLGEKDVAIGWDHVTITGTGDEQELRVDVTGEDLRSAPKFAKLD
ncbi:PRC-barrel domain-containing protein [Nitrincola iocasae]|uniref:PRC-barrel domain containing protein n=1 Tax=Nitrincola iocasae TaxID=2614693 RepID=A0A5J6LG22_9GAMM|nr:PRC-barrel domain-containing protein [Nitrincola iocasae]QEW07514.1 PRC-barrel domain containing protein [Nitrincola iocasae]